MPISAPASKTSHCTRKTRSPEIIREYWDAVGIKAMVKFLERSLFRAQEGVNVHIARAGIMPWADEITNYARGAKGFTGHGDHINYCQLWDRWADTRDAIEDLGGEEPPQGYLNTREWFSARQQVAIGSPEYMELSKKIFDFYVDQVYTIGTVGIIP